MKQSGITASKLRVILSVMVVFLIGLSAVGFYFGQSWLQTLAVSVSRTIADSKVSGGDVQSLKKIQADLLTRQGIIAKANSIMASSQDYQNQTIQDLDRYAAGTEHYHLELQLCAGSCSGCYSGCRNWGCRWRRSVRSGHRVEVSHRDADQSACLYKVAKVHVCYREQFAENASIERQSGSSDGE